MSNASHSIRIQTFKASSLSIDGQNSSTSESAGYRNERREGRTRTLPELRHPGPEWLIILVCVKLL